VKRYALTARPMRRCKEAGPKETGSESLLKVDSKRTGMEQGKGEDAGLPFMEKGLNSAESKDVLRRSTSTTYFIRKTHEADTRSGGKNPQFTKKWKLHVIV